MKFLKWIGIILLGLVGLLCVAAFILVKKAESSINKKYVVDPVALTLPSDSASLDRGKVLAMQCRHCHGDQLEGKSLFDDPSLGSIYTPNITKGKGSVVLNFTDKDWIRAVRNGVSTEGRGLFIMPANDFHAMNERDLGSVIAFVKSVPPVDKAAGKTELKAMAKILIGVGAFGEIFPANKIDHKAGFTGSYPPAGETKEYGCYLVDITGCRTCHGDKLNGAKAGDPNSPPGPNLTPTGMLSKWSQQEFIQVFRKGITPEGKALNDLFMPYKAISAHSDEELSAIYLYLKTLPAMPNGYK